MEFIFFLDYKNTSINPVAHTPSTPSPEQLRRKGGGGTGCVCVCNRIFYAQKHRIARNISNLSLTPPIGT